MKSLFKPKNQIKLFNENTKIFSLKTIKITDAESARQELQRRRKEYPRMIHTVKYANKGLYISSSSVQDYLQTLKDDLDKKYKIRHYKNNSLSQLERAF